MERKPEGFLGRNLLKIGGCVLVLGSALVLAAPYVFTRFSLYDLSGSGPIGDAIAGTTAPIVGLVGSFLVFLSLFAQYRANQIVLDELERTSNQHDVEQKAEKERFRTQQRNENFSILLDLIRDFAGEMSGFSYHGAEKVYVGNRAIRMILLKAHNGGAPKEFALLEHTLYGLQDVVKLVTEFDLDVRQRAALSSRLLSVIGKVEIVLGTFEDVLEGRLGPFAEMVMALSQSAQELVPNPTALQKR